MQDDLISIIVPVDNSEEYLDRCLESLVSQTYENIEIILVDNASSDTSPMICDSWTQKDIRVKVIHNKKGTIASAKNAGLDYANGEYITFVKANNFVDKEYLFILLKNLEETHSDISVCSLCRYYENDLQEEILEEDGNSEKTIITKNLSENNKEVIEVELSNSSEESEEEEQHNNLVDVDNDDDDDIEIDYEDNDNEDGDGYDEDYSIEEESDEEKTADYVDDYSDEKNIQTDTLQIKVLDKKKPRVRIIFFEGDDIYENFFSNVDVIKTASFAKLFRRSIFKKLRFDEDRIYEDEFIAHKIYSTCKKFVFTSSQLYFYDVKKNPYKNTKPFILKDLDKYYALEQRYNFFEQTKWQSQALNQMLIQIENLYCYARAGKADSNTLKFLKHKFKLYYSKNKRHKLRDKCFRYLPSLFYFFKTLTTKNN